MSRRETWAFVEDWIVRSGLQKELAGTSAHEALANRIDEREKQLRELLRRALPYVSSAALNDDPSECSAGYLAADISAHVDEP